jgi:hypothetical protein
MRRQCSLSGTGTRSTCDSDAMRTVGLAGANRVRRAPPAASTSATMAANPVAACRAIGVAKPCSHTQLITGAAAKSRKSMPHNPVTDESCISARFPYCE